MMLVLFALFGLASAELLPGEIFQQLSVENIEYIADHDRLLKMVVPERAGIVVTKCIDSAFNACQYGFNKALNIDPTLTWRNASALEAALNNVLSTNASQLVYVCNDNARFYQCLGTSYYDCMDLYRLIRQKNANPPQAFQYVALYRSLTFLCNAGFDEVTKQYTCLHGIPTLDAYKACLIQFYKDSSDPSNLCPAVGKAMSCLNNVFGSRCASNEAGWYGCESFRSSFSEVCFGLRCNVGGFN